MFETVLLTAYCTHRTSKTTCNCIPAVPRIIQLHY